MQTQAKDNVFFAIQKDGTKSGELTSLQTVKFYCNKELVFSSDDFLSIKNLDVIVVDKISLVSNNGFVSFDCDDVFKVFVFPVYKMVGSIWFRGNYMEIYVSKIL